ncbi:hypothetical protein [Wenyingzhuangia sp. 2_MG-2023]|uniref:hypothetical protein n=1 Tax=Wenyingzhuangia sp. 2_MG-2023 TaxID=3062639 RepID=UPI0026E4801F|nr:hypothetical protein [Wenyingzhuangia sp. 2_MG-2023]MDO6736513.1 hypothetical protein [Wenyingzhuangia sp. 2_MG-2023]
MSTYFGKENPQNLENKLKELKKSKVDTPLQYNNKFFYFSVSEQKIFEEKEAYRRNYLNKKKPMFPFNCIDLAPEYYQIKLEVYLKESKQTLSTLYNEKEETKEFLTKEINKTNEIIEYNIDYIKQHPNSKSLSQHRTNKIYKGYLMFLEKEKLELQTPKINESINNNQNLNNFKSNYYSDSWYKYENEVKKINSIDDKINYWETKIYYYKKEELELEIDGLQSLILSIDFEFRNPKNLFGIGFKVFCLNKIEKLKLEKEYNPTLKPQQNTINENLTKPDIKINKSDEVKKDLHSHIFVGKAFYVWQGMFDKFKIDKKKRTDIDFMFSVMKHHKLIHDNIRYVDIQNWINDTYEIAFEKIKFTDYKAQSNEKRLVIFNQIKSI